MSQTPACPDVPDAEREAFERAYFALNLTAVKYGLAPILRDGNSYKTARMAGAWVGWQLALSADRASRALPSMALAARPEGAAARDVLAERERQKTAEGWTPEHDDQHVNAELARAAACYAMTASYGRFTPPKIWPWEAHWWKPSQSQRGDLIKAGALILAEIERLDRADAPSTSPTAGDGHD